MHYIMATLLALFDLNRLETSLLDAIGVVFTMIESMQLTVQSAGGPVQDELVAHFFYMGAQAKLMVNGIYGFKIHPITTRAIII